MSLNFEYEELKLMALYNTGSRERLMESLTEMRTYLTLSEMPRPSARPAD